MSDLEQRYTAIASLVSPGQSSPFVPAHYLKQGILVDGTWYPITKMEWVKGQPLNAYIDQNISVPAALAKLPDAFLRLIRYLDSLGVAHGDLSLSNILVVNDVLKLVDYDSMWVPACPQLASGIVGQPDYQHPSRIVADLGPKIDRFSEVVIYLGLLATAQEPALWSKYGDGDNVLFKRSDFLNPSTSALLTAISRLPRCQTLVTSFKAICNLPIADVPSLPDFIAGRLPTARDASFRIPVAAQIPGYDVLWATDTPGLLRHIGQRVIVVGHAGTVVPGWTKKKQRYLFVNFFRDGFRCFGLTFWGSGLQTLEASGRSVEALAPSWLAVTGIVTTYLEQPYIVDPLPSEIRVLSGEKEAESLLLSANAVLTPPVTDAPLSPLPPIRTPSPPTKPGPTTGLVSPPIKLFCPFCNGPVLPMADFYYCPKCRSQVMPAETHIVRQPVAQPSGAPTGRSPSATAPAHPPESVGIPRATTTPQVTNPATPAPPSTARSSVSGRASPAPAAGLPTANVPPTGENPPKSGNRYLWIAALCGAILLFLLAAKCSARPATLPLPVAPSATPANLVQPPTSTNTPFPATPTATTAPSRTPTSTSLPTKATSAFMYVGNTGGDGAFLRSVPERAAKVKVYWDCTLAVASDRIYQNGEYWRKVSMPDMLIGWFPEQYLSTEPCR